MDKHLGLAGRIASYFIDSKLTPSHHYGLRCCWACSRSIMTTLEKRSRR